MITDDFSTRVAIMDEAMFPPKCCLNEITPAAIKSTLSRSERNLYKEKMAEYTTPLESRVYCPNPKCSAWIDAGSSQYYEGRCKKCNFSFCSTCKGPSHPAGTDCPQDSGLAALKEVARQNGWRRCPKVGCGAMVERSYGCKHM